MKLLSLFNTRITATITASATSMTLEKVTSIPTAPFMAILDAGTTKEEVVHVTAVVTTTKVATIVRAQGGTTGVAHNADCLVHACELGAVNIDLAGLTATLQGSTAGDAMKLTVTDTQTQATGLSRGLVVDYTQSGTKTVNAEVNGIAIDMLLSADVPYAYGFVFYAYDSGDPTIGFLAAISIYIDDCGDSVAAICAIDVGLATGSNSPAGRHCFMRFRNHSAGAVPDTIFQIEGNNAADYLFAFQNALGVGCLASSGITVATGDVPYIKIKISDVDYGIAVVAV